jgi:hypothetical protein
MDSSVVSEVAVAVAIQVVLQWNGLLSV